jgi:hypothetical protein
MKPTLAFGAKPADGPEPTLAERDLTERAERWAAALSGALEPQKVVPPPPPAAGAAPPVSWREGVGSLTPEGPAGAAAEPASPTERLVVTLEAGDLGELTCRVERGREGVSVVIGVDGDRAEAVLVSERATLEAALRNAGLPLASVAVVARSKLGTVLAHGPEAPPGRDAKRGALVSSEQRARSARRLKWIG